jgi:hypothetical protein
MHVGVMLNTSLAPQAVSNGAEAIGQIIIFVVGGCLVIGDLWVKDHDKKQKAIAHKAAEVLHERQRDARYAVINQQIAALQAAQCATCLRLGAAMAAERGAVERRQRESTWRRLRNLHGSESSAAAAGGGGGGWVAWLASSGRSLRTRLWYGRGVAVDFSGDGVADAVGYDVTGDGLVDALDITGDGRIDAMKVTTVRGHVPPSPPNPDGDGGRGGAGGPGPGAARDAGAGPAAAAAAAAAGVEQLLRGFAYVAPDYVYVPEES